MYRKGHVGAALLAYAPIAAVVVAIGFDGVAIGGGAVAVGLASLPDADQRVPFISHRGVTHTVHFAVGIGVLLGLGGGLVGASGGPVPAIALGAFGFVVGTVTLLSHVAADALTPMGVEPFHDAGREPGRELRPVGTRDRCRRRRVRRRRRRRGPPRSVADIGCEPADAEFTALNSPGNGHARP